MAKSGFWLRGAKGKLAGAALQKGANGETIMREIVTPTNPKTEAQMIQRIIMHTVMGAYSQMKEITDHSFEGVTKGQATMTKFMQTNLNILRQKMATEIDAGYDLGSIYAFSPLGNKILAPNEYKISEGSLPSIDVVLPNTPSTIAQVEVAQNTYQSIIDTFGLRRGDQLTFISVQGTTPNTAKFFFSRVILDPTNADGTQAALSVAFVGADNKINLPSPRNEGEFTTLSFADGKISYGYNAQTLTLAGVIVSRKVNDSWLRSTCILATADSRVAGFYPSMQQCLDNAANGGVSVTSSRYLNNAGTGAVAQESALGSSITMTLRDGSTNQVYSVGEKNGFRTLKDAEGNEFYLFGDNAQMGSYQKYLKSDGSWASAAPADASNANTACVTSYCSLDGDNIVLDDAKMQWLVSKGISMNSLMGF